MARSPLLDKLFAYMPTQTLYAAAELRVADVLADGPRSYEDVAKATGTHPPAMRRLLRALAALGVVAQLDAGRFELTELGGQLRSDAPDSIQGLVRLFAGPEVWATWGALVQAVRTGEPTWKEVTGQAPFEFFQEHADQNEIFNRAMSEHTRTIAPGLIEAYDFAQFGTIADLGGGDGTLLAAILAAVQGPRGLLFDLPPALKAADAVLDAAGVADRCEVIAGDFFEKVPPGADAYLLKSVIHDWDDERAGAILRNVRAVAGDRTRLLLVEAVMPEIVTPDEPGVAGGDLNMLVNTGGQERTEHEFRDLLAAAGFAIRSLTGPLPPSGYQVIEAAPA
jgi:O-methyltransferase domain/Dimerisation domain